MKTKKTIPRDKNGKSVSMKAAKKSSKARRMTALVTGGAGFIGSHVADELVKKGYKVVVLDDLSGGFADNVPKKAIFVKGSVRDKALIDRLFVEYKFDYVFHLAAYAAEGLSHFIRHFNYDNNLIGSIHLINASILYHVKCFVFTSSIAVYGAGQYPMTESTTPLPEDPYGVSKYAIELDLKAAHEMFGLNYVIFRPHNVYGERQNIADRYRNVIGIFMNNILQGKVMPIFGDGEQKRAFTHIADVAPVIAQSVDLKHAYNKVFNVGADTPYTINQLVESVAKALKVEPNVVYHPARNEVKIAYADHSAVRKAFKLKKKDEISLDEGIRRMAAWVMKVGTRPPVTFQGIEIERNLPPSWKS